MRQLFILNPASGPSRESDLFERAVRQVFGMKSEITRTLRRGHGGELARKAVHAGYDRVVVLGGDGTLQEISRFLVGTPTTLGIIPKGSGNGFARTLGIPLNPLKACETLAQAKPLAIDVGRINGEHFINIAGFGLDAQIAFAFEETQAAGPRGKWPYVRLGLQEYRRYAPHPLRLTHDHGDVDTTPLLVAIANGKQYGSGAKIAPQAVINDGLLHITLVQQVPWYRLLTVLPKLFAGSMTTGPFVHLFSTKNLTVTFPQTTPFHMDGETRSTTHLHADILPRALTVDVPSLYRP